MQNGSSTFYVREFKPFLDMPKPAELTSLWIYIYLIEETSCKNYKAWTMGSWEMEKALVFLDKLHIMIKKK